ncbi:MAG: prepilin-type N-terminal cleavage/methylation domain-containing protein [Campylobacterota bacterium]|nr:prepilin-type N-terminal cleavage/methylation domain-containing protein [Campylobacterota bacterium]
MKKSAFTLMELAIVIIIMSIIIGGFLNSGKAALEKKKIEDTKTTLENIKQNMISYIAVRGNLPSSNGGTAIEPLNTQAFGAKAVDNFGVPFYYDVGSQFVSADDHNICSILTDINHTTNFPQMADDTNISKYSVVAIILSSGKNKELDGINNDTDRIYSMKTNRYNVLRDDIIEELTYYEVIESVCTFNDFNHTR